jgi:NitT/TauT family transport system ATP-binding protein
MDSSTTLSSMELGLRPGADVGAGEMVIDHARIEFVSRRDRKKYVAIGDVSVDVKPNEFISVVGPSGCGKSSLMLAVAGLIPLARGSVSVNGKNVTGPEHDRAMVFQSASLLPWRSVLGNVTYGLEIMKSDKAEAKKRSLEMIQLVGLGGFESNYPHELSGGMQQRANLARALAADPQVLLMDEPFAALDSQTRELMQAELLRIWTQMKKSVMFVTHQIDEAIFLGDRVVVLGRGPATTVTKIVDVPFGRPRPESLKRTPEFVSIVDDIWTTIREN